MISKDAFENEIQNILEQLTKVYHPLKVILFGSIREGIIKGPLPLLLIAFSCF